MGTHLDTDGNVCHGIHLFSQEQVRVGWGCVKCRPDSVLFLVSGEAVGQHL